jgi:cytoskeletal protein CcmA (bactofilin family)
MMLEIFRRYPKRDYVGPVSNIDDLVREGNDLFSDKLILLDERLSGNLFCTETIVVEQNGILSGNITSKLCVVSGTINGNIVSTDQMDIKSTAIIKGNIRSAMINIEPGAVINGTVTVAEDIHEVGYLLSERIKEFSTDEYLRDKQPAELEGLDNINPLEAETEVKPGDKPYWDFKLTDSPDKFTVGDIPGEETVKLNWEFKSPKELAEINREVKSADDHSPSNLIDIMVTPSPINTPTDIEKESDETDKKSGDNLPSSSDGETYQRWW